MGAGWLETQKLTRSQYRSPRRAVLRGVIVKHTCESVMDTVGPDTGAENVAAFIVRRSDPGSYHDLGDSDSTIQLVDYDDEAFQDGTGSNPWATSYSYACRTSDWARMTAARRRAFLENGARRCAAQARHIHRRTGIVVPARRITKAESDRGVPGFIAHGDRDPARRTDPGINPPNLFPWDEFFDLYRVHAADLLGGPPPPAPAPPSPEDPFMSLTKDELNKLVSDATFAAVTSQAAVDKIEQVEKKLDAALRALAYARAHPEVLHPDKFPAVKDKATEIHGRLVDEYSR